MLKKLLLFLLLPLLILCGYGYYRYYFVFGEGVKSGVLNYVVKKGYIFKTYEGKMIQNGFKSTQAAGSIQSNEFIFSIENEEVALKLMNMGDRQVDLTYREYKNPLPWRGNSEFVVENFIVKVESLTLDKNEEILRIGDSEFLTPTIFPKEATDQTIAWTTSNQNIVSVTDKGEIKANAKGKAVIYATIGSLTSSCTVYVKDATEMASDEEDYKEKYNNLVKSLQERNTNAHNLDPQELYDNSGY